MKIINFKNYEIKIIEKKKSYLIKYKNAILTHISKFKLNETKDNIINFANNFLKKTNNIIDCYNKIIEKKKLYKEELQKSRNITETMYDKIYRSYYYFDNGIRVEIPEESLSEEDKDEIKNNYF